MAGLPEYFAIVAGRTREGRVLVAYRLIDSERLRIVMDAVGVGTSELARQCQFSNHTYVWKLRTGRASAVTDRTAATVAATLRVPVEFLFTPKPDRNARPVGMAS